MPHNLQTFFELNYTVYQNFLKIKGFVVLTFLYLKMLKALFVNYLKILSIFFNGWLLFIQKEAIDKQRNEIKKHRFNTWSTSTTICTKLLSSY